MRAGVDLDGVVADLLTPFLRKANRRFGLSLKPGDITSHNFEEWLPVKDWGEVLSIWDSDQFVLEQPLMPWAKWGMGRLKDLGYDIYIVTARKSRYKTSTLEWLEMHGIPFDEIVTGKGEEKWSYIERKKLDIFIEDRARNALEAVGFCKRVYLMDTLYNRYLDESKVTRILGGWREIIRRERQFVR